MTLWYMVNYFLLSLLALTCFLHLPCLSRLYRYGTCMSAWWQNDYMYMYVENCYMPFLEALEVDLNGTTSNYFLLSMLALTCFLHLPSSEYVSMKKRLRRKFLYMYNLHVHLHMYFLHFPSPEYADANMIKWLCRKSLYMYISSRHSSTCTCSHDNFLYGCLQDRHTCNQAMRSEESRTSSSTTCRSKISCGTTPPPKHLAT